MIIYLFIYLLRFNLVETWSNRIQSNTRLPSRSLLCYFLFYFFLRRRLFCAAFCPLEQSVE
jgi:hypothetical protein